MSAEKPSTKTYTRHSLSLEGVMVFWLVRSSAERAVLVRTLAADIVLCSWVRVPLFTQAFTNPVMDYHLIQGGVELLLVLRATAAIGISSARRATRLACACKTLPYTLNYKVEYNVIRTRESDRRGWLVFGIVHWTLFSRGTANSHQIRFAASTEVQAKWFISNFENSLNLIDFSRKESTSD